MQFAQLSFQFNCGADDDCKARVGGRCNGGVLTIDRPFLRNGLPMLAGMALAFAVVATSHLSPAVGWLVALLPPCASQLPTSLALDGNASMSIGAVKIQA